MSLNKFAASTLLVLLAAGCRAKFPFGENTTAPAIYQTSVQLLNDGKTSSAILGFERLKETLSPRDTLLPKAQYYLGVGYSRQKDHARAAEAFSRVFSIAPRDSLADDALFGMAMEYRKLWRDPGLDPTYGQSAQRELQRLLETFPGTPYTERALTQLDSLNYWFAKKDYDVAIDYWNDKLYPSAKEYFRDVAETYPTTDLARKSRIMIVRCLQKQNWAAEVATECASLKQLHGDDPEVRALCPGGPPA